jgi:para-nitrobenzyl esterase
MFWIHGGGNVMGQADRFDGGRLATAENVIVVTANYRLGVFGWFRHAALCDASTSAEEQSGNFGTLDLICALQWIRTNIRQFGGDPDCVTIFGESAGGSNVYSLMVSPKAAGLFHRAIAQSGLVDTTSVECAENRSDDHVAGTVRSSAELLLQLLIQDGVAASRQGAIRTLEHMSSRDIARLLRNKTYSDLMLTCTAIPDTDAALPFALGIPQLFRDGTVIPADGILGAIARGAYNRVPVILGSNRDEFSVLLPLFGPSPFVSWEPGAQVGSVTDGRRFSLAVEYTSRLWKANNVDAVATELIRYQPDSVFVYRFDWSELAPAPWWNNLRLGAAHGLDVPFVLGHRRLGPEYLHIPLIKGAAVSSYEDLSAKMMGYWTRFAADGRPMSGDRADLPQWKPWTAGSPAGGTTLLLNSAAGGGVHHEPLLVTKDGILADLAKDGRIGSEVGRRLFAQQLASIRGGGLSNSEHMDI